MSKRPTTDKPWPAQTVEQQVSHRVIAEGHRRLADLANRKAGAVDVLFGAAARKPNKASPFTRSGSTCDALVFGQIGLMSIAGRALAHRAVPFVKLRR